MPMIREAMPSASLQALIFACGVAAGTLLAVLAVIALYPH
jgi:hypothetical protein